MSDRRTTLERAYELARSGECVSLTAVKARLKAEGYHDADRQLYGPALGKALRQLCETTGRAKAEARGEEAGPA